MGGAESDENAGSLERRRKRVDLNGKVEKKMVPKQALRWPTQSFDNSKLRLGCNNSVGSPRDLYCPPKNKPKIMLGMNSDESKECSVCKLFCSN